MKIERDEQAFWDRCVFACLSTGKPSDYAASDADSSVILRRKRMAEPTPNPYRDETHDPDCEMLKMGNNPLAWKSIDCDCSLKLGGHR